MNRCRLSKFNTEGFDKGADIYKQLLWFVVNALIVKASWNPLMGLKLALLKLFGAKIGTGIVIKNGVNIKFPWKLELGNNVWLGESVWIDNLDRVVIGDDVCISQGALLLTGNHDYTASEFYYRNAPIHIEVGVWIGAKATVSPGVVARSHSILTVGSVATREMKPYFIYQGNPAEVIKQRVIR